MFCQQNHNLELSYKEINKSLATLLDAEKVVK